MLGALVVAAGGFVLVLGPLVVTAIVVADGGFALVLGALVVAAGGIALHFVRSHGPDGTQAQRRARQAETKLEPKWLRAVV